MLLAEMGEAYAQRVRWEARVQAVEIGKVIAGMLGNREPEARGTRARGTGARVPADTLLKQMGVKVGRQAR